MHSLFPEWYPDGQHAPAVANGRSPGLGQYRSTVSLGQLGDLIHGHWSLEKETEGNILKLGYLRDLYEETYINSSGTPEILKLRDLAEIRHC